MNLPLNGRIAIIDDQLNQAEPLMKILSKKRLPFSYFSGELKFLPEIDEVQNDTRILFLDINLLDNSERENKELKAILVPVLQRVISQDNYPYVIIYWSRHEHHRKLLEDDIFNNDLKDRKPIAYLSAIKSDFFNLDGTVTDDFEEKIDSLFNKVNDLIKDLPAYNYLLNWENNVHFASDATLQEIFSSYHRFPDWSNNANFIIEKLGLAYLGKYFKDCSPEDKIKASFISFNCVFKDTLEQLIYRSSVPNPIDLAYDKTQVISKINFINEKLNFSSDPKELCESGNIIVFDDNDDLFAKLLFRILSIFKLKRILKVEKKEIEDVELKNLATKEFKRIKEEIKNSWVKIAIVVTPVCDFVQKENKIYDRIVKGLLIPIEYKGYIEDRSEAVYMLPISIHFQSRDYLLIIDFRYFETLDLIKEKVTPKYRVRQELLAEIQSRLARHINRQGILFLDEL